MTELVSGKSIAVSIQSEVQFFSLLPVLKELQARSYNLVVLVDDYMEDTSGYGKMGYGKMAKKTIDLIKTSGVHFKKLTNQEKNHTFDLCLMPYEDKTIKSRCYIKYEYGTLNIKPSLTYVPELMEGFHGFLCQSTISRELLSAYGKTFAVENLRFLNKKRIKHTGKKRVLFAPTYNDMSDAEYLLEVIESLKKNYYVIVKSHHGVEYLVKNKDRKAVLKNVADEYYGSETELADLIMSVDACIFDNSSAIGEALYAGVPCAIVAKDLDFFRLGDIHTTQYKIVKEGFLPYSEKPGDADVLVKKATSVEYRNKQKELSAKLFLSEFKTGVQGYIDAIDYFLNDQNAQDYIKLHDYVLADKLKLAQERDLLMEQIKAYNEQISRQNAKLEDFSKRKLYRVADKLYKIEGRILNVKN